MPTSERTARPTAAAARTLLPFSLLLFAAVRVLCLVTLAVWAGAEGRSAHKVLAERWDSLWYVRVVEHGYDFTLTAPDGRVLSDRAFFPLLPWLEKAGQGLTGLAPQDVGLGVSAVASLAAAWAIHRIAARLYGERAALFAVALWAVLPVSVVQSMAYSESLFTALAAWSLWSLLRERWLVAGLLASAAGLTRPVGLAVVLAVWGAAWAGRRLTWRVVAGCVLAPLGAAGYVLWSGLSSGHGVFGYLDVQGDWGNGFDGGLAFARFLGDLLSGPGFAGGIGLIIGVAALIWLYVRGIRQGQPLPLVLYTGVVLLLALCTSGFFGSKPRLLLPAFPLLLPLALALSHLRRPWTAWLVVAAAAGVAAGYGAFWLLGSGPP
ncbi:glycosyltransferase family 39 protein [Streptomyces sp. NPDC047046]|uniref:glycosyltransferase family 39 protein n=1 Tax=Streptomyces sp. NPDC047046 TaxID=3155378 RepID=UPI0033FB73C4